MSQYSEMMGSFIRTGNYPLEANYIFPTEQELIKFYKDDLNKTTMHRGLLRVVLDDGTGKQALYWVVKKETNNDLKFTKLISFNNIQELQDAVDELDKKLQQEIKERKEEDEAIYGTDNRLQIPDDLNSILDLANAVLELRDDLQDEIDRATTAEGNLKQDIKYIVGTEEDDIKKYIDTYLDYPTLTDISNELNRFLNTVDDSDESINTFLELQKFLSGYKDTDKLKDVLQKLVDDIMGDPYPNPPFRTLRGIQDFVQTLASVNKNRMDNIQTELDQTQVGVGLSGDGAYNADKETYYLKDATSVMNALKILDSLINEAINNCNLQSEDTETVKIDIKKEASKTTISARVKISPEPGNDIVAKEDGIYHNIDSEYLNGILTIKVNGNIRQQHVLGLSSIVDTAYYSPEQEAIIIVFRLLNGEKQNIVIPAGALIQEWTVDNSISTKVVELTKDRVLGDGPDKLSADVRISTNKYNILEKDGNTLLVKGTADNIIFDGDVSVKSKLQAEIDRAISKDDALERALTNEVLRAKEVENELASEIASEIVRASRAEEALDSKIDTQIAESRRIEEEIIKDLDKEIERSTTRDDALSKAIAEEQIRAIEAENTLAQNLNKEIERSTLQDQQHTERITSVINNLTSLNTKIDNEITRATTKENEINLSVQTERDRAMDAENNLQTQLQLETQRATNKETFLEEKIDNVKDRLEEEITRSTTQDSRLNTAILNEVARSTEADNRLTTDLATESSRAQTAEATIQSNLDAEVVRAIDKEAALDHRIDDLWKQLDDNASGDNSLLERITTVENNLVKETNRAQLAEQSLANEINNTNTNLTQEIDRAKNAETNLQDQINQANTDVTNLDQKLTQEITRSTNADNQLQINIDNEATRAQDAEQAIAKELQDLIVKCISSKATTAAEAQAELAKLGEKFSTVEEIGRTLKQFLEDTDYADSTINKWKEIESFLSGISDQETLTGLLNQITQNSKEEINNLQKALEQETIRAETAEKELKDLINAETTRAETAEKLLESKVDTSISVLETKIETVKENVETNIGNKIDTLQDALNQEISRSTQKDADTDDRLNNLNLAINNEIVRATSEENIINQRIDNIKGSLDKTISDQSEISEKLTNEIIRSTNKDIELENKITNSVTELTNKINTDVHLLEDSLGDHIYDYNNPHKVTAAQVGLGKVDNTTDLEKPISVAVQEELNKINIALSKTASSSDLSDHILDKNNPHNVTKGQLDLGNVDNTSDLNKPISTATQLALDKKSDINHTHTMTDIADLEVPPISKGFVTLLSELPENAKGGDKYIITTVGPSGKYGYTLVEYDGSNGTWKQKTLSEGITTSVIGGDVYKLTADGPERILDASDYIYFYNKIYNETKDLIEDIDWEEDDTADTNNQIRLKITYKTQYGDPNESEVTNPYVAKEVKYLDIEKARFISDAYSRPATTEDVTKGYATAVGEPLLILVLTTGNHVTISLKDSLNIYDPVDTPSIDMSVSDWTGDPTTSYKVSGNVRIATNQDSTDAVTLHVLDSTEKGLYSTLRTTNTNSITLTPNYGSTQKSLTADLNINNSLNNSSDVLLTIDSSGLSAKIVWGEYE